MAGTLQVPRTLARFVRNATRGSIGAAAEHTAQIALMPEGPHTEANLLGSFAAIEPRVSLYRELDPSSFGNDGFLLHLERFPFVIAALEDQYALELSRLQELPSDRFTQARDARLQLDLFMAEARMAADTNAQDDGPHRG